jgi:heme exporter protein A
MASTREIMLQARNLSCIRDERLLFQAVSFCVQPGEIVQIAGANGAGKTSLLRILVGLLHPDDGEVSWSGKNIYHDREHYYQHLLFLGHQSGMKSLLTPWENLTFYHAEKYHANSDILCQVLSAAGLAGCEDVPVAALSAGQQRRVALARLGLSRVPLWILDEPLTALDQQGRQQIILLFERHLSLGGMIIFTTHHELEKMTTAVRTICLSDIQEQ